MIFNTVKHINNKNISANKLHEFNFLKKEVASRLLERIDEVKKEFNTVLDIGCSIGEICELLQHNPKVKDIYQVDNSQSRLNKNPFANKHLANYHQLPFNDNHFDLVVSVFDLHTENNIRAVFQEVYRVLKQDGLFLVSIPTIGTLENLEQAFIKTDLHFYNEIKNNRIHPLPNLKDITNILYEAKFKEVMADSDTIEIMYKSFNQVLEDIKGMGEGYCLQKESFEVPPKAYFETAASLFERFKDQETNRYPVEVKFANIVGWKTKESKKVFQIN